MPEFQALCPQCNVERTFDELIRERRGAKSERAVRAMEFKVEMEYKFRCKTCGNRFEKVVDKQGQLHKWTGNRHIVQAIGGA